MSSLVTQKITKLATSCQFKVSCRSPIREKVKGGDKAPRKVDNACSKERRGSKACSDVRREGMVCGEERRGGNTSNKVIKKRRQDLQKRKE